MRNNISTTKSMQDLETDLACRLGIASVRRDLIFLLRILLINDHEMQLDLQPERIMIRLYKNKNNILSLTISSVGNVDVDMNWHIDKTYSCIIKSIKYMHSSELLEIAVFMTLCLLTGVEIIDVNTASL